MMIRTMGHAVLGMALALASGAAAAADCYETINNLIVHSNGNVYFKTDQSCTGAWCQLNWSATATKNGLATLMAAQAQGRKVLFTWPAITACTQQNATYASPDYIQLYPPQ